MTTGLLQGRSVLVTGGCGMIGSRIAGELRNFGPTTVSLDSMDAYPFNYRSFFGVDLVYDEIIEGRIEDLSTLTSIVSDCDYVIHAAARADVAECTRNGQRAIRKNIDAAEALLLAIQRVGCERPVVVSSASIYGYGHGGCWREDDIVSPISSYANYKAWLERETAIRCDQANVDWGTLRFFGIRRTTDNEGRWSFLGVFPPS